MAARRLLVIAGWNASLSSVMAGLDPAISLRTMCVPREITGSSPVMTIRIEEGIAQGEFADQDVNLAGFAILGAVNWISKWYNARGPRTAQEVAVAFADFFRRGLG
jgi:hypothetical protein